MIPEKIGRYEILEPLGQGAISTVYRAYDPHLGREVALKLITPQDPIEADRWRQRFRFREVRAAARLNHPHIVTVYDVGLEHEPPYLVMELLTGGTLKKLLLQQKFLPWREVLILLQPLCQALAYAHQAGIIHRDVKPANVMFASDKARTLKLVDFGLARLQDLPEEQRITQAGSVMGTLAYMSPEQAREEVVDGRTDIFALGVICFEAINGHNPLDRDKPLSTLAEVISNQPIDTSPLIGKAPPEVIRLIERAIAKNRDQRYPTCEALLADLDRCLGTQTRDSTTRPDRPVIQKARDIHLTLEIKAVLRAMFSDFDSIGVEAEFGHGLSGGRAFRVSPVKRGQGKLPAVVKIAPISLIQQEWEAYEDHVKDTLPDIARIESAPISLPGIPWGGLRYALAGAGIYEIQSLHDYYHKASTDNLLRILEKNLLRTMGLCWWLRNQTRPNFQMQAEYDALLPVNLLIKPTDASSKGITHLIEPSSLPPPPIAAGDHVQIKGFVITEIDEERQQLTLNLPSTEDLPSNSYRLRLENVSDIKRYRVGGVVDSIYGEVTATRDDLLARLASEALDMTIDPSMEWLVSPGGLSLPNPLAIYQDLLYHFFKVRISTVHRDFNLENILIDEKGNVILIDFATVRRGHVLHDLLRLETEVVTKLIPEVLAKVKLPPETIHTFYEQLHYATFQPHRFTSPKLPHAGLEKPFKMLVAIRKMARKCLFNQDDWTEYYQGLTLYLLGALKFKNLDELPEAPLPKQVAFWAAATIQKWLPYLTEQIPTPVPTPWGAATIQKWLSRKPLPLPSVRAVQSVLQSVKAVVKAAPNRSRKVLTFLADRCRILYKKLSAIYLVFREKLRLKSPVVGVMVAVILIALALLLPGVINGIIKKKEESPDRQTATAIAIAPTRETLVPTETYTPTDTPSPAPTSTGTPTPTPTAAPTSVFFAVKANLKLRSGPSTRYDIVGWLEKGDRLIVTGNNLEGDWLKVICLDGKEGWVVRSWLEVTCVDGWPVLTPPPTPTPLPAPTLLEPENGALFISPEVQLKWEWIRPLGDNEYFSVRVRPERDSEACWHPQVKETQYSGKLNGCESGKHYWSVGVARRDDGSPTGWWEISAASEERWFEYIR